MKLIVAIIKPFKISDVKQALSEIEIHRMTVVEAKGYGRQRGHAELYKGAEYRIDFVPKVRLEIAVADDDAGRVIDAIMKAARTDTIGDGKIFLLPIEEALRIRTGESGEDAL